MSRLNQANVLAMSGRAIEAAGDVDILMLDKTGTITDGTMKVKEVITLAKEKEFDIDQIMGSFLNAQEDNNQTSIALQNRFGINVEYKKSIVLPFSSSRKLSAVTFEGNIGTFIFLNLYIPVKAKNFYKLSIVRLLWVIVS